MKNESKLRNFPGIPAGLGVLLILSASLIIFSGCASTEGGAMATARKIHSMTPCGMMMGMMMDHGDGEHGDDEAHHEIESNIDPQADSGQPEECDAHLHAAALEQ